MLKKILKCTIVLFFYQTPHLYAGTYNFYFNNTEQGNNSKASPQLVVKDGKQESKVEASEENTPTESLPQEGKSATPAIIPLQQAKKQSYWRITGSYVAITQHNHFDFDEPDFNSDSFPFFKRTQPKRSSGIILSTSYFITPYLGMGVVLGSANGIEVEANLGDNLHALNAGIVAGLLSPGFSTFRPMMHIGARVGANFTKSIGISASARSSLLFDFTMFDAGLVFRI